MKFLLSLLFLLVTFQSGFAAPPKPTAPAVGRLHAGWAMTSITPDVPVALAGQFHKRISERIETPVTATALLSRRALVIKQSTKPSWCRVIW